MRPLSPCVTSAKQTLPEKVTAWEFARHLFVMHPEYTHGKMEKYLSEIDASFDGEVKTTDEWLTLISEQFPKEELLHTRLVMIGLCEIDPMLHQLMPKDVLFLLGNETNFHKS